MPGEHTLGDLVEIDDRTVLVFGQALDVAHEQPDVGTRSCTGPGSTWSSSTPA